MELGIKSFKMFMTYKKRPGRMCDDDYICNAMEMVAKGGGVLQLHCESGNIIEYLENPPTAAELQVLGSQLGLEPSGFIRSKESAYAALDPSGSERSESQLLDAMAAEPILIERPIVVRGDTAVLGRPPENVHQLL